MKGLSILPLLSWQHPRRRPAQGAYSYPAPRKRYRQPYGRASMTDDRITELLARAWITCDPNRGETDPDDIEKGEHMKPGSDAIGKPKWYWFVPRALALRDFLSDHGYVIRPKEKE
jgi:hypothetical protein